MNGVVNNRKRSSGLVTQRRAQGNVFATQQQEGGSRIGQREIGAQIAGYIGVVRDTYVDIGRPHHPRGGQIIGAIGTVTNHPDGLPIVAGPSGSPSGSAGGERHVGAAGNANARGGGVGGKRNTDFTQVTVGTEQRNIQITRGSIRRIAGVGQFNVAGTRRCPTDQTGHVAAVVNVITGSATTHAEEAAADEHIGGVGFHGNGIHRVPLVDGRIDG